MEPSKNSVTLPRWLHRPDEKTSPQQQQQQLGPPPSGRAEVEPAAPPPLRALPAAGACPGPPLPGLPEARTLVG